MGELAIGRKEIMKVLHVGSWRTIQVWKKNDPGFNRILRTAPNNKPFMVVREAVEWFVQYDKLRREKLRSNKT